MFFGLTNSPITFQTIINTIFHNLITDRSMMVYMDDMAIHTAAQPGEIEGNHIM